MTPAAPDRRIDYIEFPVTDLAAAKRFYAAVFGWKFEDYGPEYASFHDGRLSGGFRLETQIVRGGPLAVLYATDLATVEGQVKERAAAACGRRSRSRGGRRFHFMDPSGNELAVWTDR